MDQSDTRGLCVEWTDRIVREAGNGLCQVAKPGTEEAPKTLADLLPEDTRKALPVITLRLLAKTPQQVHSASAALGDISNQLPTIHDELAACEDRGRAWELACQLFGALNAAIAENLILRRRTDTLVNEMICNAVRPERERFNIRTDGYFRP